MTFVQHFISTGPFQNSKGCFLTVNSTLLFGWRWSGRSPLWFTEVPKWLILIVLFGWFATIFRGDTFYVRNIHLYKFFATAGCCSKREKFRAGSGIEHWCFRYGQYNAFFKGHKVCLARIVICVSCADNSIRWHVRLHILYVIAFQLFTSRIVNEAVFAVHFLCQCVMRVTCIIAGKDWIFLQVYYSVAILSVLPCMNLCNTYFQISHCGQILRGECWSLN